MSQFVSVIIPAYNAGKYLEASVKSVLSQSHRELECIIVDDGSTDETRIFAERLAQEDSRVSCFYKENGGAASARNLGARHAKGDWLFFLDADDWMYLDIIEIQLNRALDSGLKSKIIVYSDFEVIWQDQEGVARDKYTNKLYQMTKQQLIERIMSYETGPTMPLSPINTLLSKDIFDVASYDESFGGWEEINFFIDLLLMEETSFLYVQAVASVYRIHGENSTSDIDFTFANYVRFLQAVYEKDKSLLQYCVRVGPLIRKAILRRDRKRFELLVGLVKNTNVPVYLFNNRVNMNMHLVLRMIYDLSPFLPTRQIRALYKRITPQHH